MSDEGTTRDVSAGYRIFDSLFHHDLHHHSQGSGLNLAIAKEIIEELGGQISYKFRAEGGAHFEISFDVEMLVI